MSEFKGTPGPWSVNHVGKHWNNSSLEHIEITFSEDGECVCDTVYRKEDADLIAAAPDLLAALMLFADEEIMAQLNGSEFVDSVDDEEWVKFRFVAKDFRKAAAAIRKALGEA